MNFRKFLTTLILGAAVLAAFACQYTGTVGIYPDIYTDGNGRQFDLLKKRRFIYLSGVNAPGNHISGVTYSGSGGNNQLTWTANNYQTVSLPLTVYVGVADVLGGVWGLHPEHYVDTSSPGLEMEEITITVQYRVMPEAQWHTAGTKKFATGAVAVLSKQRIFGDLQIDCDAAAGSVVLIRIWVAVNTLWHYSWKNGLLTVGLPGYNAYDVNICSRFIENADREALGVENTSEIQAIEQHVSWLASTGTVSGPGIEPHEEITEFLSTDLHMSGSRDTSAYGTLIPQYSDGWTPQFLMAVTIGDKRRPGK